MDACWEASSIPGRVPCPQWLGTMPDPPTGLSGGQIGGARGKGDDEPPSQRPTDRAGGYRTPGPHGHGCEWQHPRAPAHLAPRPPHTERASALGCGGSADTPSRASGERRVFQEGRGPEGQPETLSSDHKAEATLQPPLPSVPDSRSPGPGMSQVASWSLTLGLGGWRATIGMHFIFTKMCNEL